MHLFRLVLDSKQSVLKTERTSRFSEPDSPQNQLFLAIIAAFF